MSLLKVSEVTSTLRHQLCNQHHIQGGSGCSLRTDYRIIPAARADSVGDLPNFFLEASGMSV